MSRATTARDGSSDMDPLSEATQILGRAKALSAQCEPASHEPYSLSGIIFVLTLGGIWSRQRSEGAFRAIT